MQEQLAVEKYLRMRAARVYSFDRKVYDRSIKRFSPFGLNLGLSMLTASAPSAVASLNLAALFAGAHQVLQSDLGITYGGTPKATAGNTATTVLSLTGALTTAPVPIWAVATNTLAIGAGAQFNVYYDGLGVTPAMTGVTPSVATPVALTGAATGLSVAWAAGTSVATNSWKATCSSWADQSGNGRHAVQASAALQPVIGVGLNGKIELLFDGVDDQMRTTILQPPANSLLYILLRHLTSSAFACVTDGGTPVATNVFMLRQTGAAAGNVQSFNGTALVGGQLAVGTNGRIACVFNGASSSIKVGSLATVNGNAGSTVPGEPSRMIGSRGDSSSFASFALFALVWAPPTATTAADAAINTSAGYGVGSMAT